MSRSIYDTSRSVERMRIQITNKLNAVDRQVDSLAEEQVILYESMERQLRLWEAQLDKMLGQTLTEFPVWDSWLRHVKGVDTVMGAHLLNTLLPPLPDKGVGTWFKAAGLYVLEDNRMPHRTKGQKIDYNMWLRRCLWMQADIFTKVGGYYKAIYKQHCTRLAEKHRGQPEWNDPHIHSVARWSTVKLFLSHLYEAWLEAEGAPYERKVYAERVLGHQYIPVPQWDGKNKI